jgi:hypothetical protein
MAKYQIDYACGHGSYEEQLVGPMELRERKIAWLRDNKVCKTCYIARKRAEDAAAPRIAYVEAEPMSLTVTVRISGGVEDNKEALMALGFAWTAEYGGFASLLATREPPTALCRTHTFTGSPEMIAWLEGVSAEIAPLGYQTKTSISDLDVEMFRRTLADCAAKAADQAAKAAAHPRPARPDWYQAAMTVAKAKAGGRDVSTNGKIYGRKGRQAIYIDGTKIEMTDAQADELRTYQAALTAYRAALKS